MTLATLPKDTRGTNIQVLGIGTTQTFTVNATSAQSTAISNSNIVRILSTTNCHILMGTNPTATTSEIFISAFVPEYFEITVNDKIAAIRNTDDGIIYITEMV